MSQTIKYPLNTEKSIRMIESDNKMIFIVDIKAKKQEIKQEIEKMFNVKVDGITTAVHNGEKRAYVKFSAETPALDIATQMGLM